MNPAHLVGVHNADDLTVRDGTPVRVNLAACVVEVARLAVHLAGGAGPAGYIAHIAAQLLAQPPLGAGVRPARLAVGAVIAQVDGAVAACKLTIVLGK